MDIDKTITAVRADIKACGESLIRNAEICDTPEELDQLNACVQSVRQTLAYAASNIAKAMQQIKPPDNGN